jgi:AcrR family transcriptional regulator
LSHPFSIVPPADAPLKPRRLPPEERRALLLEAAIELFATRPASEVSMAAIAARAGVSKALAFRYFSSKRELFVAAAGEVLRRMEDAGTPDPSLPPEIRFREGLSDLLAMTERYPHALRSFAAGDLGRDPEVRQLVAAAQERAVQRIISRLGIDRPNARLRHAVRSWLGFVRSSNLEWIERGEVSRETLIDLELVAFRTVVADALGMTIEVHARGRGGPQLP